MRHRIFEQTENNNSAVRAAGLRKKFNRSHDAFPGELVTMDGKTGEYKEISVRPGSDKVHVTLYRSEGDLKNARTIEIADKFKVNVGVMDRPEIRAPWYY